METVVKTQQAPAKAVKVDDATGARSTRAILSGTTRINPDFEPRSIMRSGNNFSEHDTHSSPLTNISRLARPWRFGG